MRRTCAGDCLEGQAGADVPSGGPGDDRLVGGLGADRSWATTAATNARDGVRERVDCGPGSDRALVDRRDRVTGCERVERR